MNETIHRGDPGYRRRVLVLLVACFVASAAGLAWLRDWIAGLTPEAAADGIAPLPALRLLFLALAFSLALPLLALAAWLHRERRRIEHAGRYPAPGTRTLGDVPIRTGEAAVAIARRHHRLAQACLLLAAAVSAWALWTLLKY